MILEKPTVAPEPDCVGCFQCPRTGDGGCKPRGLIGLKIGSARRNIRTVDRVIIVGKLSAQMNKEDILGEIRRTAKANGGAVLGWRRSNDEERGHFVRSKQLPPPRQQCRFPV